MAGVFTRIGNRMTTSRTVKQTVTFRHPFRLAGLEDALPAGEYLTETDEERLEGLSFPAYRKLRVLIHMPRRATRPGVTETVWIDPVELEEALARDAAADGGPDGVTP